MLARNGVQVTAKLWKIEDIVALLPVEAPKKRETYKKK